MSIIEEAVFAEVETEAKYYPVHWIAAGQRREIAFCSQKEERRMSRELMEVTCFECIHLIADK